MHAVGWMAVSPAFGDLQIHVGPKSALSRNLSFTSQEWSVLCTSAEGDGVVFCNDGSTMLVDIGAKGPGVTVGSGRSRMASASHYTSMASRLSAPVSQPAATSAWSGQVPRVS